METRKLPVFVVMLALLAASAWAVPPLVVGDVEPAEPGQMELYLGQRTQTKANGDDKIKNHMELVYGIRPGQEISLDLPYITKESDGLDSSGIGDIAIGTKIQYAKETARRPAMGASLEIKLANGSEEKGLGSGEVDYDLRWRAEKWFGKNDTILNIGHIFVGDPTEGGVKTNLPNVTYWALAVRRPVSDSLRLLAEVYGNTPEEYGGQDMVGFNVGFSYRDKSGRRWHAAWGQGLDGPSRQELRTRLYFGTKWTY